MSISCGSRTALGVTKTGNILGWGASHSKVLGEDVNEDAVTVPKSIEINAKMIAVATRGAHALGVDDKGRVWSWGRGEQEQAKDTKPYLVRFNPPLKTLIRFISTGRMHSVAVTDMGDLYTWGASDEGQTGLRISDYVPTPVMVSGLPGAAKGVSCGSRHTLVVVATPQGDVVYGFGGNSYSQLGLGDKEPRFEPTLLFSEEEDPDPKDVHLNVACGYRHSFIYTRSKAWGFGWNSNKQASCSNHGVISKPALAIPSICPEGFDIHEIAAGGRHTLVLCKDANPSRSNLPEKAYRVLAFGRGSSGELGFDRYLGDVSEPRPILALIHTSHPPPKIACGWEHSIVSLGGGGRVEHSFSDHLKSTFFSRIRGDVDAALVQLVNAVVLLRVVPERTRAGAGMTIALGNLLFGGYAYKSNATALPHGLNTVALFALENGAYRTSLAKHPGDETRALGACLFCAGAACIVQAICAVTVAPFLKKYVPRAALASAVAGVALAFITTTFLGQVLDYPTSGLASLMVLLIGFGARENMPFGLPVAFVASFAGFAFSYLQTIPLAGNTSRTDASPFAASHETGTSPMISMAARSELMYAAFDMEHVPLLVTVVFPLVVMNVINNLACVEQSRAAGDVFVGSTALLLDSLSTFVGALVFGNPFPTCIYVGHSGFKAMGATYVYSFVNAALVFSLALGHPEILWYVISAIPPAALVPMLVWIGCVVTADAFKSKNKGVSVAIGLVPALAAWRSSSTPPSGSNIAVGGINVLGEGYMVVSIILGSVVEHIIDRRFAEATTWLVIAAFLSSVGWIHKSDAGGLARGYLAAACVTASWATAQWWGGEREGDSDEDRALAQIGLGGAPVLRDLDERESIHGGFPAAGTPPVKYGAV